MIPKGQLLLIGGSEDRGEKKVLGDRQKVAFEPFAILRTLIAEKKHCHIEIITTGSIMKDKIRRIYQTAFKKMKHPHLGFMPINSKIEANQKKYLQRIEKAGAVFFSGGDQFRIATILGGTKLIDKIKQRYISDPTFFVAGTSAGAMAMSNLMITEGDCQESLYNDDLKTSSGLGIIHDCIIDTHFIKRGRFGRLAHAVILNSDQLGIGLCEDTALLIKHGSDATVLGSGMAVVIDGKLIRQTNMSRAESHEAIYVENLKVHLLTKGCRFSIKTRKLRKPVISKKGQQKIRKENA